jgi:hypothetical protein
MLGKYLRASSLSLALMVCSICSLVMPSMVVGICVGKEDGLRFWMSTVPRVLSGASLEDGAWAGAEPVAWARANTGNAAAKAAAKG